MPLIFSVVSDLAVGDWIWVAGGYERWQVRSLESGKRRLHNNHTHTRPALVVAISAEGDELVVTLDLRDGGEPIALRMGAGDMIFQASGPGLVRDGRRARRSRTQ
jgi:hypothetical protein